MPGSRSIHRLARLVLATVAVLGAGVLVAVGAAVIAGAGSLRGAPGAGHDFAVAGQPLTYPSANVAALAIVALAGTGLIAVGRAARSLARHGLAARRFRRAVAGAPQAPTGAVRLRGERPVAFCAGLWAPRVYLSEGALGVLDPQQLRAVLAHEEHHRRRRDPLRLLLLTCLADALFFLPAVGRLRDRYAALTELRADDAAVATCDGDPAALAGAMLLFDADGQAGPAGAVGVAPERVDRLLGAPPALDVGGPLLALGAATVAVMLATAWRAGRAASLKATFALPVLSHRPCVVAFAALPLWLGTASVALAARLRTARR